MSKSIKDTFIENMIMEQHGEKIKHVQELLIKGIEEDKKYIENNIIWEISNGKNTEVIEKYGEQLDDVNSLLEDVRFNFLNIRLETIKHKIFCHSSNGLKEYEELVEALKQSSKCESCVHTYEENNVDKVKVVLDKEWNEAFKEVTLKSKEVVLNSEEADKILKNADKISEAEELGKTISDAVRIFISITNPDTSKDNLADIAKQIAEKLKKNNGSW